MPTPKPPYPMAFRQQMVELVQARRKPADLAREFKCNACSIHTWVHAASTIHGGAGADANAPLSPSERQELIERRRTLRQVQMERDILAKGDEEGKTARWAVLPRNARFASKSEKTFTPSTNA